MTARNKDHDVANRDLNRDPITGERGSHPVGVGVGSAAGGAAAGALAGTVFGPIGTLIGAGVGVIAGAAAGKGVAERIDPTGEIEYWREEHKNRPYVKDGNDFDRDYAAAYGYGLQAREQHGERDWKSTEGELGKNWEAERGESQLSWDEAKLAARDSYQRADRTHRTYQESDRHFESRFQQADYTRENETFDDYRPAYRYGVHARTRHGKREWDKSLEEQLGRDWESNRGASSLPWERAKIGVQEAFSSPYIDDDYNSPYDQKPDYNDPPGVGLFKVR